MTEYNFPYITSVTIENFSLYKKAQEITINIDKNVFSLVGANGLGKSTFITILNYALTGIVKHPKRTFTWYNSINRFYTLSKTFAATYFDGRVSEEDIDTAQVTLTFNLGNIKYKIVRGFFEPDEIRLLEITDPNGEKCEFDELSPNEIDSEYRKNFLKDSGLSEFSQFAFLQSYVFTFDETHQLLFWDPAIMERVLYLFFGLDSAVAKKADKLRKEYTTFDSNARNFQWRITQSRNELKTMLESMGDNANSGGSDIVEKHQSLIKDVETANENLDKIESEIKETDLSIADLALKISSLKIEYDNLFNQSLKNEIPIEKDTILLKYVKDIKSKIFADEPFQESLEKMITYLQEAKRESKSTIDLDILTNLKKIDEILGKEIDKQESFQKRKERFVQKEKEINIEINTLETSIKEIEAENENIFKNQNSPKNNDSIEVIKKSFKDQIERFKEQKAESYSKRDLQKSN